MAARAKTPEDFLPLKPQTFLVLLALNQVSRHGYGIKKEVRAQSDGAIDLEPGGLYRMIARLEGRGLISPRERRPAGAEGDDERRRYYDLSVLGRQVLAAEARRMVELVGLPEVAALADGRD